MNPKLTHILSNLGLREAESSLYLAGLTLGPTTILALSRKSGIKRSTIYGIIEELKQKGLCWEQMTGWKKSFVMAGPKQLQSILEQRKLELQKALPEFESLTNLDEQSRSIEYYKDLAGIKTVYAEVLAEIRDGGYLYIIGNLEKWYELDADFFGDYILQRNTKAVKYDYPIKAIFDLSKEFISHPNMQNHDNMEIKLTAMSKDKSNILITQDLLLIQQLSDPIHGIVIRNPGAIKIQKEMFEMIWAGLK